MGRKAVFHRISLIFYANTNCCSSNVFTILPVFMKVSFTRIVMVCLFTTKPVHMIFSEVGGGG